MPTIRGAGRAKLPILSLRERGDQCAFWPVTQFQAQMLLNISLQKDDIKTLLAVQLCDIKETLKHVTGYFHSFVAAWISSYNFTPLAYNSEPFGLLIIT